MPNTYLYCEQLCVYSVSNAPALCCNDPFTPTSSAKKTYWIDFSTHFFPYQYRRSNHETVSKGNNYLGRCSSARCRMLAAIHKVPIILCSAATYMQLCATIGTFNSTSLPAYVCVHHLLLVIQICQYTTKRLFSLCTSNGDIKTTSHTELLISFLSTSRRFY